MKNQPIVIEEINLKYFHRSNHVYGVPNTKTNRPLQQIEMSRTFPSVVL